MRLTILTALILATLLLALAAPVHAEGSGVKVFSPSESFVRADSLPYLYNGSFIVSNDGQQAGVYVIRVSVDDPVAISWINVTPVAFVLNPGETRVVQFEINISPEQAKTGTFSLIFTPTLLPRNVEPYLDTFAQYVSIVDHYNVTLEVPPINGEFEAGPEAVNVTPVFFVEAPGRVNLVQYSRPVEGNKEVIEIDRAVRINAPQNATVGKVAPVSLSVFEGLSNRGIDLIAVSPDGIFYPISGENLTFTQAGEWGIIAAVGDQILLGKPVTVSEPETQFAMPGLDTILAAIALLLLLSIVPIWLLTRNRGTDPYRDITFKAYVIRKYIDHFDTDRLRRAVGAIEDEYYSLIARNARGDKEAARASLDELRTLTHLESGAPAEAQ